MGVKGLSKNVIKQVWRDDSLSALPPGTRVGVDTAGWLHKAVVSNAAAIVREQSSVSHHSVIVKSITQLLHAQLKVILVLDGARWPLKKATHARRASARAAALEKADEAVAADDWATAEKFYKQAVRVPDEFISWVIEHVQNVSDVSVVVANYEADAQLAKLAKDGVVDLVYSAAQDSDFLLYSGMGDIMYDLRQDGTFKRINYEADVHGRAIEQFNFSGWSVEQFRVWSAACGCDYVDNPPTWGAVKLYHLVSEHLQLSLLDLIGVVASKASDASSYAVELLAAVRSFAHHVVFEKAAGGGITQVHLEPLPDGMGLSAYTTLTTDQCAGVYTGALDPTTLGPRVAPSVADDPNAPALEADFSRGQRPVQYSVARLKAYLVNRGIPLPALMSRRDALVELVEKVLSYPEGTWPIIRPWAAEMATWTRADPVMLNAQDPLCGEALWSLLHSPTFPELTDLHLDMLMTAKWENTRQRGLKLYLDGMCRLSQLSVQFGTHGTDPVWCFRMPVHASMRGNYWMARLCVSASRLYLAPSSGCECENGCVACSHQVALLCVLRRAQECDTYSQFQEAGKAFAADTLASGAVHWWHILFPWTIKSKQRPRGGREQQGASLETLALKERAHPFEAAELCATDDRVLEDSKPLFAPGSNAHRQYVQRALDTSSFSSGMAAQVVRLDPTWRSVAVTLDWSRAVSVGSDEPLSEADLYGQCADSNMPDAPLTPHATSPALESSPMQDAGSASHSPLSILRRTLLRSRDSPPVRSRTRDRDEAEQGSPALLAGRRVTRGVRPRNIFRI
jgi:5'-3' exonuclease